MPDYLLPFDKRRAPDLPAPEKRKKPSASQIRAIIIRQNNCCNTCPAVLVERDAAGGFIRIVQPFQIDHIQRLDALGAQTLDNLQALCIACHKVKTKTDNREAKKGRRIRGEAGRQKRMREKGPVMKSAKRPIQSRPGQLRGGGFGKPKDHVSALSKDHPGYRKPKFGRYSKTTGGQP